MALDLRKQDSEHAISRVGRALDVKFDHTTEVRKRRSIGYRTDRDTWVRIETRPTNKIDGQGWNGVEAASILRGIAKPAWYQAIAWSDTEHDMMWRADETELVASPPIIRAGDLTVDPNLSESWWATLTHSLSVLAQYETNRMATPTMQPITQDRVTSSIHQVFPGIDTTIDEWVTAHGDFFWQNLTAPECYLLDWEDWGTAPRGFDAASLWHDSLSVPVLADSVYQHLRTELESRSGLVCQLMHCAATITAPPGYADQIVEPAKEHAQRIISQLTQSE